MSRIWFACFLLCTQLEMGATIPHPPAIRLGADVAPLSYQVSLVITPGKPVFAGDITIELTVKSPVDQVWLHAEDLQIDSATFSASAENDQPRIVTSASGFAGFLLERGVRPGPATLRIHYTGTISDKPGPGISHSSRNQANYVVTHFEPIAARRVFPCFDEPGFKVPWQLTIDAPKDEMVVSNTAVESDTITGDRHRVAFHQTKPLPPYLVAFTIGAYEAIDLGSVGRAHVPTRLIVPKNDRNKAGFAAELIPEIVKRLEAYFDINYPYEKLDQVAVPNYPEGSAMEDAGSIFYDDSLILCAADNLTHEKKEWILSLILHETTHQWFGDLVTLKWWDDAWLNEGFTEWLEWKIETQIGPEWRSNPRKIADLGRVVSQDVLPSAHPVRQKIESASQIETEFDDITYFKTAHALQMIEHYVGETKFQSAVRAYLRGHLFGNANARDFLNEFAKVDPQAESALSQFLNRTGLPQITLALDCASAEPVLHVRQDEFRPVGVGAKATSEPWTFPICLKYPGKNATESQCWLASNPEFDIRLRTDQCPDWLLANEAESGYYISRYDGSTFDRLAKHLSSLSQLERLHMLWEVGFLLRSGLQQPSQVTQTIGAYGEPSTVSDLLALLNAAAPLLRYESTRETAHMLVEYFSSTFGQIGRKLGWAEAPGATATDRRDQYSAVAKIASWSEDAELIAQARRLSLKWLADRHSVPADLVPYVLAVSGEFADAAFYGKLVRAALDEKDHENKMALIRGFSRVRDPQLIQKNFALFASGSLSLSDSVSLVLSPAFQRDRESRRMPLQFVKQRMSELKDLLPRPLGRDYSVEFSMLAVSLCSEQDRLMAESVLAPMLNPEEGGRQRLTEALDAIRLCTAAVQATEGDFVHAMTAGAKTASQSH